MQWSSIFAKELFRGVILGWEIQLQKNRHNSHNFRNNKNFIFWVCLNFLTHLPLNDWSQRACPINFKNRKFNFRFWNSIAPITLNNIPVKSVNWFKSPRHSKWLEPLWWGWVDGSRNFEMLILQPLFTQFEFSGSYNWMIQWQHYPEIQIRKLQYFGSTIRSYTKTSKHSSLKKLPGQKILHNVLGNLRVSFQIVFPGLLRVAVDHHQPLVMIGPNQNR